ncbi:GIY-YIG nuclease family protein [Wukongibacter sp. M2B1]|uniref:GIY-YIG nuclease family protein n=1 Tax=Wukongibacter sp. M2B1 TaxID=3088895 RepID=UPI003D7BF3D6
MNRKKELKLKYKQMKPEMGIYKICSKDSNKCYIKTTQDLKGTINGDKFKLGTGNHPNRELQRAWNEFGEDYFIIEILEKLEYDKDESKTDYTEDLALLQMIWEEKLLKQEIEFYKK